MKLDVLDAFDLYMAVSTHFKSDKYDFFQYKGRFNRKVITMEKLISKNYYHALMSLSRQYEAKQLCEYFVANMIVRNGEYMFDVDTEGKRIYNDFKRRRESRTYIFKQDVARICMELEKLGIKLFWESTTVYEDKHPLLFRMFVGSFIAPETMCILMKLYNYTNEWDDTIKDDLFYPTVAKLIRKLEPFIRIQDLGPYRDIIFDEEAKIC